MASRFMTAAGESYRAFGMRKDARPLDYSLVSWNEAVPAVAVALAEAQAVDGFAACHAQQPCRGIGGRATLPMRQGRDGGLLQSLFRQREIAAPGDKGGQKPPPILLHRLRERRVDHPKTTSGRTSTVP